MAKTSKGAIFSSSCANVLEHYEKGSIFGSESEKEPRNDLHRLFTSILQEWRSSSLLSLHPFILTPDFPLFGYLVEPNILRVFCIITGLACIVAGFATIKRLFVGYVALLLGGLTAIVMHFYKGDAMAYVGILIDAGITIYIASCYKEFLPSRYLSEKDEDDEWDDDDE